MTTKKCTGCCREKDIEQFWKRSDRPSGRMSRCKDCKGRSTRSWRSANPEAVSAHRATDYERHRDRVMSYQTAYRRQWRKGHPDETRILAHAHKAVRAAIKRGDLVKPDVCEACGLSRSVQAAHYDYSRPLDIRWLCRSCHSKWDHDQPKLGEARQFPT